MRRKKSKGSFRKRRRFRSKRWTPTSIMRVKQITDLALFTSSITLDTGKAYSITLANFDGVADFSSMFDQYRIVHCKVTVRPEQNMAINVASAVGASIISAVDYDDDTSPPSVASLRQFQTAKEHDNYKPFSLSFVPHCAYALYGGAFTKFGNIAHPWCDMANTDIKHYGFKFVIPVTQVVQIWTVELEAHLEFKNVR